MADYRMPSLGADMDAGTILEWRVGPGDEVHRGDIVAVVDTEKSDIEVEAFVDGVVEEILVEPGREVAVGTPLARIRTAGEPAAEPGTVPAAPEPREAPASAGLTVPAGPPGPDRPAPLRTEPLRAGPVRASPLARRRAAELGVDLAAVAGRGPGGAVLAPDLTGASPPEVRPPVGDGEPSSGGEAVARPHATRDRQASMRQAIGDLMSRSAREIPQYRLGTTVDLGAALGWLGDRNEGQPASRRLLPAALVLKATAVAARRVPGFNGTWDGGYRPSEAVHLGVAVSLRGGGLVAPAIHDADRMALDDLMAALRDLVERARAGRLRGSEMADPTLTVTNLGDRGAEEVHGLIYPPQVALVGVGRIVDRPWADRGMVGVRPTVRLTLAADHRVTDGHDGSRLLTTIADLLGTPEDL